MSELLCCDGPGCDEWYHGSCIGVNKADAEKEYLCPRCRVRRAAQSLLAAGRAYAARCLGVPVDELPEAPLLLEPAPDNSGMDMFGILSDSER